VSSLLTPTVNDEPVIQSKSLQQKGDRFVDWKQQKRIWNRGGKAEYLKKMVNTEPYTYNNTAAFDSDQRQVAETDIEYGHKGVHNFFLAIFNLIY
jgi:hypothetical protein